MCNGSRELVYWEQATCVMGAGNMCIGSREHM